MKAALIATVYNEAATIETWLHSLLSQTQIPEEVVIVDGGSTDGTDGKIEAFVAAEGDKFGRFELIRVRCNIARGRNVAIAATQADIIASSDAGSKLDAAWFEVITKPLCEQPDIAVVAGWTEPAGRTVVQKQLLEYETPLSRIDPRTYLPSSRTIAFRKEAWQAVGGYPEWLTLTGEDALFNQNLKAAGFRFQFEPRALVYWEPRPDLPSFHRQMISYGFGAAEAQLYAASYRAAALRVFFPPMLLWAKRPFHNVWFRYCWHCASIRGWVRGKLRGKKPPADWRNVGGILLSPETQAWLRRALKERRAADGAAEINRPR